MKNIYFISIILFIINCQLSIVNCQLSIVNCHAQTYFNKDFGNDTSSYSDGDFIYEFADTSGYLAVGSFAGTQGRHLRFLRLNNLGDTIWSKFYGKSNVIQFSTNGNYVNLGDTNFVFVGTIYVDTLNPTPDSTQTVLYKIDTAGNVLWNFRFGDTNKQHPPSDIKPTADGGYIISGFTTGWGATNATSSFLLKVDSNGVEQWHKIYGGGLFREAYSVEVTQDNGYIMAGRFYQSTATKEDINVVKTDSLGNLLWSKTYGTPERDSYGFITKYGATNDYILTATINIGSGFNVGDFQAYMARISGANGNIIWVDTMGIVQTGVQDSYTSNVIILPDGYIIGVGGTNYQSSIGNSDAWIVKYDGNGNLLWQRTFNKYGGNNQNYFWDVRQTFDGGFILCGDLTNTAVPEQNLWVLKLDSNGCDVANCTVGIDEVRPPSGDLGGIIYPNPSNGVFNITTDFSSKANVEVYNISGQLIKSLTIKGSGSIDISKQPNGIYFVKVIQNNGVTTQKIIKN